MKIIESVDIERFVWRNGTPGMFWKKGVSCEEGRGGVFFGKILAICCGGISQYFAIVQYITK